MKTKLLQLIFAASFFCSSLLKSQAGLAINCDGVDDYVDPNTLVTTINNNFTFEMWARPTATHEIDTESTTGFGGLSGQNFALWPTWHNSDGGIGVSIGTNGVSVYEHGSNFLPALAVWSGTLTGWTHVAISIVNKQPSIYINGTLVHTGLTSTKSFVYPSLGECNQYPGLIGGIGGGSYGYYKGDLDEFRMWPVLRTQTEIQQYMNTELGCSNGTYAYYKFNDGIGGGNNTALSTTPDFSGNNFTATLTTFSNSGSISNWISPGAPLTAFPPQVTSSNSGGQICAGVTTTLSLSSGTGTWSQGATSSSIVVTPSSTTIYSVSVSSGTCVYSDNYTVTGSGAQTYSWSTGASTASVSVSPTLTTVYTFTGTGSNGCSASKTVTIQVSNCTSINSIVEDTPIKLYPNPAAEKFFIQSNEEINLVSITDLTGKILEIKAEKTSKNNLEINTSTYPKGIYFVNINSGKLTRTLKLVKE